MIKLASLRTRMVLFFVVLLVMVQLLAALLVTRANSQIARDTIDQALAQGELIFRRLLAQNQARLEQGAAILSADFAFRQAIASNDTGTIYSVLKNHGARAGANVMMLIALDGTVRADTLDQSRVGKPFGFKDLVAPSGAQTERAASRTVVLDGKLFQLVAVPVLAPETIAWVALAFEVDDAAARELRQLSGLEVSFLTSEGGKWRMHASTLAPLLRELLTGNLPQSAASSNRPLELDLGGEEFETRVTRLTAPSARTDATIVAVLQRPLSEALQPFARVNSVFFWLALGSLITLVAGSVIIARNITQPVQRLAEAARRIQSGDYATDVAVEQKDELGELAQSFNLMLRGIATREREILRLAYEDTLTGLPNRAMFRDRLEELVAAARNEQQRFAVLLAGMDRFKAINDTLGHPVGDQALREVALRVRAVLRDSDVVARLGGDEFAVLLATDDDERIPIVARKILTALEAPLVIEGQSMDIAASIGIAQYPEHGADANDLLRAADVAMYVAKRESAGFSFYDPASDERRQEHLTLLGELRRAVEADELVLHYQPKISLNGTPVRAAEALVRWNHPTRGFISPSEFIPFAEQTGAISAITRWVVDHAIAQCGAWHRAGLGVRVSVNVSARDLRDGETLVRIVGAALAVDEVPPALLSLEITESGLMDDPRNAQATLRRLQALGVVISIDDYGTGYSSLAYIKQLAVNELKIDRTFVHGMEADRNNAAIVRSTIELGHNLGLAVVAEGVETAHELAELKRFGCDMAQGHHIAKPMPADAFETWLGQQPRDLQSVGH
jgi:diguanylate cyclase (GGDEF)-like protein